MLKTIITSSALVALALTTVACGGTSGPVGPSGIENTYEVTINGEAEEFDAIDALISSTSSTTITLRLHGSVDPLKDAIDDEYSVSLAIGFDRAALLALTAPTTLQIKGTSTWLADDNNGAGIVPTLELGEGAAPALRSFFLSRSCFCFDPDAGSQTVSGTFVIDELKPTELTGTLSIRVQGDMPNYTPNAVVEIRSRINLAIP